MTELGDETRHMVMFGRTIQHIGGTPVRPRRYQRMIINALPLVFRGPVLWVAALVGEEIFDALQRQVLDDPQLQPIVRRVMRIHVTEEARHIQFARDGARRKVTELRPISRIVLGTIHSAGGPFYRYLFTHPAPYRRAGLDVDRARRLAKASAHFQELQRTGFAPLAQFLEEVGLMSRLGRWMWQRSKFL